MWEFWIKPKDLRLRGSSVQAVAIKGNVMKSFRIALQLQDCARIVQSWTRTAFPIENVRKIINPSPIDQSKLQWDYKRISDPATIHWIWNQILGTRFFFNPDRIGLIIWQSTKNVAIRLQFQINPNLTAHRQVLGLESRAGSYPCSRGLYNPKGQFRNLKILSQSRISFFVIHRIMAQLWKRSQFDCNLTIQPQSLGMWKTGSSIVSGSQRVDGPRVLVTKIC